MIFEPGDVVAFSDRKGRPRYMRVVEEKRGCVHGTECDALGGQYNDGKHWRKRPQDCTPMYMRNVGVKMHY